MGDDVPIAACRASPIRPAITSASSSSMRNPEPVMERDSMLDFETLRGSLGMHMAIEIGRKALRGRRKARVFGQVIRIRGIMVRQWKRPCAAGTNSHRFQVKAPECPGS